LTNNGLVKVNEDLNFSGLIPIYQDSPNFYPPDDEYDVAVWDERGNKYLDSPEPGQPFNIITTAGPVTNVNGENFTINLTGIPPESDATNVKFTVKTDGDNVTFSVPTPETTEWQKVKDVITGITITDIGGASVNGSSVMYAVSKNNGNTWNDWTAVSGLTSEESIFASENVTFKEGTNNLIKWRALDTLGNGPAESSEHRISVDTEEVLFTEPEPLDSYVSPTELVQVGITISDITSGVNASTIEYSVSTDKSSSWSAWFPVTGFASGSTVNPLFNHTFKNGTDNRIKWRAYDIAGNGPTESLIYRVNVNTWIDPTKPVVKLLEPMQGSTINTSEIELSWELVDADFTDIKYDVYFSNSTPPEIHITDHDQTIITVKGLKHGETYYWNVIPKAGGVTGSSESGIWWFKVKLPGIPLPGEDIYFVDIGGPDSLLVKTGESESIELTLTNYGSIEDTIEISIDTGGLTKSYIDFDESDAVLDSEASSKRTFTVSVPAAASAGTFNVTVTVTSAGGGPSIMDEHTITIVIQKKAVGPGDTDDKGDSDKDSTMLMLAILAIVIVVIILVVAFLMKKKKVEEEKEEAPIPEVPAVVPVTPAPEQPPAALAVVPEAVPAPAPVQPEAVPAEAPPPIEEAAAEPAVDEPTEQPEAAADVPPAEPPEPQVPAAEATELPAEDGAVPVEETPEPAGVEEKAEPQVAGVTKPVEKKIEED
jgi:hypothetical protein